MLYDLTATTFGKQFKDVVESSKTDSSAGFLCGVSIFACLATTVASDVEAERRARRPSQQIPPFPADEAQEPDLEPILRGLTMGASLAGETAGNVIKVGALKLACESLPVRVPPDAGPCAIRLGHVRSSFAH